MGQPWPLLFIFVLFKHKFYKKNTVDVSGIRTRIVGLEGEYLDHLTTPTAQNVCYLQLLRSAAECCPSSPAC